MKGYFLKKNKKNTHLVNNSCVYVKHNCLCFMCRFGQRSSESDFRDWEFSCWCLPCADAMPFLSIIWWLVPSSKADIHREVCMQVCECLQCQSLTPTHRGQTNALIRSWHAATTFPLLPLRPLSLSPLLFSAPLLSFGLLFYVSLFLTQTNTFVPISATQLRGTPSELR